MPVPDREAFDTSPPHSGTGRQTVQFWLDGLSRHSRVPPPLPLPRNTTALKAKHLADTSACVTFPYSVHYFPAKINDNWDFSRESKATAGYGALGDVYR